jgi:4-hydroxymandelate oxidase
MRVDLGALEQAVRGRLPEAVFDYVTSGGGDEHTLAANTADWERIRLRPRVLRDVSRVTTETAVVGGTVAAPILVAPTAGHALVHPDHEIGMAAAAAAAGTVMAVSMMASVAIEEIAQAVPGAQLWMHVTMLSDRRRSQALCERAAAAGCRALVLTVDSPVASVRPRSQRHGILALAGGAPPNLTLPGDAASADVMEIVTGFDRGVTPADIATLASWSGLPVVVKGVIRGDDAVDCVRAGAAGVVVSNHGGRQLDQCVSTAAALEDVVAAVDGAIDVYVDGGIRRGVQVLAALALGARAVLVGRLPLWGLALAGREGAQDVLAQLTEEFAAALALCGLRATGDISPDLLVTHRGAPVES